MTLGSSSTLDGYTFPATLQVLPFLWSSASIVHADQAVGLERLLLQSSVAVKYVPLVVRRTPGTKTGTDTSSDRKGSITYSLPLLGTAPIQSYSKAIRAAIQKEITKAIQAAGPGASVKPVDLATAATKARDQVAAEYSQFSLLASAGFGWDTRQDKPNSFNAGLTGTKVLTPVSEIVKPSHYTWILNASAVEAWFQSVSVTPAFSRFSGSLGVDFQLPSGVIFSLVPNLDHYSDGGYAAILGFANTTRHDDVTLKEAVTFKIAGGNKVALSVSEEHLGTSDHDVAINLAVNYKLPFPPDVGGAAPEAWDEEVGAGRMWALSRPLNRDLLLGDLATRSTRVSGDRDATGSRNRASAAIARSGEHAATGRARVAPRRRTGPAPAGAGPARRNQRRYPADRRAPRRCLAILRMTRALGSTGPCCMAVAWSHSMILRRSGMPSRSK